MWNDINRYEITPDEVQVVRDLLIFFLEDGTHPVNVDDAIALQERMRTR